MSTRPVPPSHGGEVAVAVATAAPRASRRLEQVLSVVPPRRDPLPTSIPSSNNHSDGFLEGATGMWYNKDLPEETVKVNSVPISTKQWTAITKKEYDLLLKDLEPMFKKDYETRNPFWSTFATGIYDLDGLYFKDKDGGDWGRRFGAYRFWIHFESRDRFYVVATNNFVDNFVYGKQPKNYPKR